MPFWDFTHEASLPAAFTAQTGGSGSVAVSGGYLVVDQGGSASSDYAGVVYGTALDMSAINIIAVEFRMTGANAGAFSYPVLSLIDSSGQPTTLTASAMDTARRFWFEDQRSSSDTYDRCIQKFKTLTLKKSK